LPGKTSITISAAIAAGRCLKCRRWFQLQDLNFREVFVLPGTSSSFTEFARIVSKPIQRLEEEAGRLKKFSLAAFVGEDENFHAELAK
jgi:hypothetical protein